MSCSLKQLRHTDKGDISTEYGNLAIGKKWCCIR